MAMYLKVTSTAYADYCLTPSDWSQGGVTPCPGSTSPGQGYGTMLGWWVSLLPTTPGHTIDPLPD